MLFYFELRQILFGLNGGRRVYYIKTLNSSRTGQVIYQHGHLLFYKPVTFIARAATALKQTLNLTMFVILFNWLLAKCTPLPSPCLRAPYFYSRPSFADASKVFPPSYLSLAVLIWVRLPFRCIGRLAPCIYSTFFGFDLDDRQRWFQPYTYQVQNHLQIHPVDHHAPDKTLDMHRTQAFYCI